MTTSSEQMRRPDVDYSRKWYAMAAVAMGIFLSTIDGSIVNIALPTLERELNTTFAIVQWVALGYFLTVTILLLSVGRLADIIGKKLLYTLGFIIFTVGSGLCGVAPTIAWLIGFRVLQAVGAAMMMALGPAIVTEAFPPSERGKALGITGLMVSIGIVVGPALGGVLIEQFSWHWIFFVNIPVGIVGILIVLRFVPDTRPPGGQRFDYLGAATLCLSLLGLLLGLTLGQQFGFDQQIIRMLFAGWIIFLLIFIFIEWKSRQPMVDLTLFRNSLFSINLINGLISFILVAGSLMLIPFYLENILGYDTQRVGLLLAPVPIALGVAAPIAGALSDRVGTRAITIVGLLVMLVGYAGLMSLDTHTSVLGYILRFLPVGLGMGIFQSPNNSAVMGTVPQTRLGVASGLLAMTRTLGQTVGIALLGTIWASRVAAAASEPLTGETTDAPALAQVAGLHDTFFVAVVLLLLALGLSTWGLLQERRATLRRRESSRPVA
ncbi:MAG: MFS transporter [Chloroflexaceae bacterium]